MQNRAIPISGRLRTHPSTPTRVSHPPKKRFLNILQEFSIPLIAGVIAALVAANVAPEWYHHWFGVEHGGGGEGGHGVVNLLPQISIFGHAITANFLINDIFMVLFFGIAAKEITEAALPGGSLNPVRKAINPLIATLGGVIGPVAVFFILVKVAAGSGAYPADDAARMAEVHRGWGIPTATDIALAWLVARAVFGKGHPAINFLLLLAVADDAIGLVIIAVFYGDPANPAAPQWLGLVVLAMLVAFAMRKAKVRNWIPYIVVAGPIAWSGLILAHLHPALALVFIVPFLPGPKRDTGLFEEADEADRMGAPLAADLGIHHSPLHQFEHQLKTFVDFGLFFFALGNAGVAFQEIGTMTWIILASLVVGKTIGITLLGFLATKIGFPLPARMGGKELVMAGFVAALGLTVALFVCGAAYPGLPQLQGQAKMGALFSAGVGIVAVVLARILGFGREPRAE